MSVADDATACCTACTTVANADAGATITCTAADNSVVTACAAGYWKDTSGTANVCTGCVAGKYITAGGAAETDCIVCAAGTYSAAVAATAASTCSDCAAGKYSAATGADANTACIDCVAGKYSTTAGADAVGTCIDCVLGTYVTATGSSAATDCADCAVGKYTAATASTAAGDCIVCPDGKYSVTVPIGISDCINCVAVTHAASSATYFCTTATDTAVSACDTGYTNTGTSTSAAGGTGGGGTADLCQDVTEPTITIDSATATNADGSSYSISATNTALVTSGTTITFTLTVADVVGLSATPVPWSAISTSTGCDASSLTQTPTDCSADNSVPCRLTIVCSALSTSGDITIGVAAGGFTDATGNNQNLASTPATLTVTSDVTPPAVSIVATTTNADTTTTWSSSASVTDATVPVSGDILFTITLTDDFRLDADPLEWADMTLVACSVSGSAASAFASGPTCSGVTSCVYTLLCDGLTTTANIEAAIAASKFTDTGLNANGASTPANLQVKSDNTPPTVTVTAASTNPRTPGSSSGGALGYGSYSSASCGSECMAGGPIVFTITVADDFDTGTNPLAAFSAVTPSANCDAAAFTSQTPSDCQGQTSCVYVVTCSALAASADVTMGVEVGKFKDRANSPNTAASTPATLTLLSDTVSPSVTISSTSCSGYDAGVTACATNPSNALVRTGYAKAATVTFTFTLTDLVSDAGAGGFAAAFDGSGGQFTQSMITATNCNNPVFAGSLTSGSTTGAAYTLICDGHAVTDDGPLAISVAVAADLFTDRAGNPNTASVADATSDNAYVMQSDRKPPVLTATMSTDNSFVRGGVTITEPRWAKVNTIITLNIEVSEDILMPSVSIATAALTKCTAGVTCPATDNIQHDSSCSNGADQCNKYTAVYTVTSSSAEETAGVSVSITAYEDFTAGNAGAEVTSAPLPTAVLTTVTAAGGSCSDSSVSTMADCQALGSCSVSSLTTESACTSGGTCSDTSVSTQTDCANLGTCSQGPATLQATCVALGTCSDTAQTTESDCTTASGTWTAATWSAAAGTWTAGTWTSAGATWTSQTTSANQIVRIDVSAPVLGGCTDFPKDQSGTALVFTTDPGQPHGTQPCPTEGTAGATAGFTWQPAGGGSCSACTASGSHTSRDECVDAHLAKAVQAIYEHADTTDNSLTAISATTSASDTDSGGPFLRIIPTWNGAIPTYSTQFPVTEFGGTPHTVTLTLHDAAGNTATCDVDMTIHDDEPPTLDCDQLTGTNKVNVVSTGNAAAPAGIVSDVDVVTTSLVKVSDNVPVGSCSDSSAASEAACLAIGACTVTSATTQAACEALGVCTNGGSTSEVSQAACGAIGTCSDSSATTQSDCGSKGTCSVTASGGGALTTQSTCVAQVGCSITSATTQSECSTAGTCSGQNCPRPSPSRPTLSTRLLSFSHRD